MLDRSRELCYINSMTYGTRCRQQAHKRGSMYVTVETRHTCDVGSMPNVEGSIKAVERSSLSSSWLELAGRLGAEVQTGKTQFASRLPIIAAVI